MPAHALSRFLHFDSEIAVHGAADQGVVAQSPVAIQADSGEMTHEGISRSGGLHKKRTGFGIPAKDTSESIFIHAGRVDGSGVNGIACRNTQNRFDHRRELAIKRRRNKLVPLWSARTALRDPNGPELNFPRMRRIERIGEEECSGESVVLERAVAFL